MCTLTNCAKVHKQVNNEVEKSSKTIKNFENPSSLMYWSELVQRLPTPVTRPGTGT